MSELAEIYTDTTVSALANKYLQDFANEFYTPEGSNNLANVGHIFIRQLERSPSLIQCPSLLSFPLGDHILSKEFGEDWTKHQINFAYTSRTTAQNIDLEMGVHFEGLDDPKYLEESYWGFGPICTNKGRGLVNAVLIYKQIPEGESVNYLLNLCLLAAKICNENPKLYSHTVIARALKEIGIDFETDMAFRQLFRDQFETIPGT